MVKNILLFSFLIFLSFWIFREVSSPGKPSVDFVDKVVVLKSNSKLQLIKNDIPVFECKVSFGENPKGPKIQEGDERTPEGNYILDYRNPNSQYHKSIHVSYPNAEDKKRAQRLGLSPGGLIMIHGLRKDLAWIGKMHLLSNWTNGCIAVTNEEMDIIWQLVRNGTPIEIKP